VKTRVVPAKELTARNLTAKHYIQNKAMPRWLARNKRDEKKTVLAEISALTWFAAVQEACRKTGLDQDQLDVSLAVGEVSPHDHNDSGPPAPKHRSR
jgi:hypothetical protein